MFSFSVSTKKITHGGENRMQKLLFSAEKRKTLNFSQFQECLRTQLKPPGHSVFLLPGVAELSFSVYKVKITCDGENRRQKILFSAEKSGKTH